MTEENELHKDPPTGLKNRTDYDFPNGWHNLTQEEKHDWFVRERVFRQAIRQDTTFGRKYKTKEHDPEAIPLPEAYRRAKNRDTKE